MEADALCFSVGALSGALAALIWFGFNGCPFKYCANDECPNKGDAADDTEEGQ